MIAALARTDNEVAFTDLEVLQSLIRVDELRVVDHSLQDPGMVIYVLAYSRSLSGSEKAVQSIKTTLRSWQSVG